MSKLLPFALATVPFLFNTGLQVSGISNAATTVVCWILAATILVVASVHRTREWHRSRVSAGALGVQAWHILLGGLWGLWLFMSVALGAASWMIWNQQGFAIGNSAIGVGAAQDQGPIQWVYNLSMLGGGNSPKVFSLSFRGANITKDRAIRLKEASIVSLIDGTLLPLEIVAVDAAGENKVVSLEKVQLIPPGAPIELTVRFGGLDTEGRIQGIDSKPFLEKWRQFAFIAKDDERSYRMEFNENFMAVFFQGKVGPRVAIKSE